MIKKSHKKLILRVYKLNNLTFIKVNKAVTGDGPWDIAKSLTSGSDCGKIESGKMKRFKKK